MNAEKADSRNGQAPDWIALASVLAGTNFIPRRLVHALPEPKGVRVPTAGRPVTGGGVAVAVTDSAALLVPKVTPGPAGLLRITQMPTPTPAATTRSPNSASIPPMPPPCA